MAHVLDGLGYGFRVISLPPRGLVFFSRNEIIKYFDGGSCPYHLGFC